MSLGAAAVGASFSPINPFQVGHRAEGRRARAAERLGASARSSWLAAWLIWIAGTMRFARRTRVAAGGRRGPTGPPPPAGGRRPSSASSWSTFVIFVVGVIKFGWDFEQLAGLFFLMGVAAGLVGRLGSAGRRTGYVEGFRSMAFAALLIGFARGIYVVLDEGHIVDTIVHGLFTPIAALPTTLSALGMMAVHAVVHLPVPSTSGQAVLTMPLLVPLSDLIGLSRQVTVLAYQYGAGLCELVTPTNGALMAMLAASGVRYEDWLRFVVPVLGALVALAVVAIGAAVATGLR